MDAIAGLPAASRPAATLAGRPDAETVAAERPEDHRAELRLWLRLLACSNMIETEVRRRLREGFGVTLPRFDLLAQLDKSADGLTLSEVSQRMMVSNGNLTGLVERLVASGHVERRPSPRDRRAQVVRLTELGRQDFAVMAAAHEGWIAAMFAGLGAGGIDELMRLLARAKLSVGAATGGAGP